MSKLPTPDYQLTEQSVYPPAEDTFLLMDALEADRKLIASLAPALCVEIGCGSGVVSTFWHKLFDGVDTGSSNTSTTATTSGGKGLIAPISICTDLNIHALRSTRRTFQLNEREDWRLHLLHCNMLDPLLNRLCSSVDILLMNPPYVPTEQPAQNEQELCFAGGPSGRALLDHLLPLVADMLTAHGLFYLVALRENGVAELCSPTTIKKFGVEGTVVLERQCRNEHLSVIRFRRKDAESKQKEQTDGEICKKEEPNYSTPMSSPIKSSSSPAKITIHLKPVGGAPQLQKDHSKLSVKPTSTVATIQQALRKWLNMPKSDSLYLFVAESFALFPEHTIGNLYACFGSRDSPSPKLYLQYGTTPAWG